MSDPARSTTPPAEPVLSVQGLTAGYNRVSAIRGLSFDLAPGEVIAMLGPNGAGKTTSLLAMVGLVPLMSGSVTALGAAVDAKRPHKLARRGVLLVPDDRGVFYGLTVRDHFRLAARKADPGREEAVLDRFPALRNLLGRKVGLCSGGEQQMLTIARTLMGNPTLLLLDEPSEGLAPLVVEYLKDQIAALKGAGLSILLAEQNVEFSLDLADRVYILEKGEIRYTGTASELRDNEAIRHQYLAL
jgi:branched-chain amino acid transport system ATP-binding protein